jgi:alpha-tubulin suppressor-like RCC1 family protein
MLLFMKTKRNLIQIWLLSAVFSTLNLHPSTAFAQPVIQVAGGDGHSLFLKSDGSLWGMGWNDLGQLGDGTTNNADRPEQIVAGSVTAVAGGGYHSLFLKNDGSLWGMGANVYGQLGDGTTTNTDWPEQIVASNVTAIAAGRQHSLFLKGDGSLWGMGWNYYGQLGNGSLRNTNRPQLIVASNVTAIAAGYAHSLFLENDGSLWAMGWNDWGQLGVGRNVYTPPLPFRPEPVVASNVTAIAAAIYHSLFLKSDGSLWGMGGDFYGQLGDGRGPGDWIVYLPEQIVASNVTAIAAAGDHSLFLKNDGSLWATGWNNDGQLGDGTDNYYTNLPEQIVAGGVTAIAAGETHSLFLKSDGSLWAMGANTTNMTNLPGLILPGPPGYGSNQVSIQLLSGGAVCSYFGGVAGSNYALDRTFSLSPANWVPQATNPAGAWGVAVFTNTPDPGVNNFWRIRAVP